VDVKKLTVLVLFGGRSAEHEVSIRSASSVINALDVCKYDVIPVAISKEGRWLAPTRSAKLLKNVTRELKTPRRTLISSGTKSALIRIDSDRTSGVDVVFPVLHGPYGEDGTVQGLLEMAALPYVGAGVTGSAVGMDKDILKRIFREAGLPVVDFLMVPRSRWRRHRDEVTAEICARFRFPVFVKPACLGSSVGIRKVKSRKALRNAMNYASRFDAKILVEQGVHPIELECAVLGNDDPVASCVGQIIPGGEFYDYDEKYTYDRTKLIIPARIPGKVAEEVRRLSLLAFKLADCAGMARVDFLFDKPTRKLYVSELNTIPGFTSISMYPKMWEYSGLPYPRLLDRLIELALERHADRGRNRVDR
jgi:D-alanine-D-alanine ligase